MNKQTLDVTADAARLWDGMNASERHGVRFGLFPGRLFVDAPHRPSGWTRAITTALMDIADVVDRERRGGS